MDNNNWTITVEQDFETGELIIPLPQELLDQQGWKEGDEFAWIDNQDGSWTLEKIINDQDQS
jgi:hypothetical protein